MTMDEQEPKRIEPVLPAEEVRERLEALPEWQAAAGAIERRFSFNDFIEAIAFVNRVAALAEKSQHHPDLHISYNRVRIVLSTHSSGGITGKDFDLAGRIERLIGPRTGD